jgi:purine-nucleoside phosphorylase
MQGRFHPYEGYSSALCSMPIKIFKIMGVKLVILTNAAGGINPEYKVGDLMLLKDHISLPGLALSHPLIGPNDERFGPRFVPLNKIYNKKLRDVFKECSNDLNVKVHEGCYGSIGGPTYEVNLFHSYLFMV